MLAVDLGMRGIGGLGLEGKQGRTEDCDEDEDYG